MMYVKGPVIGLPKDIPFRADREYTFCRMCGDLYQPEEERVADHLYTWVLQQESIRKQKLWREAHNKTHPDWRHRQFTASGRFLSPEATYRLVPYGIIPLSDLVLDNESEHAGLEAPRISVFDNLQWHD
jgi:hypothetical protein